MSNGNQPPPTTYQRFTAAVGPPKGSWLQKHGKTIAWGGLITGGLVIGGVVVYSVIQTAEGAFNPPPVNQTLCEQLSAELGSSTQPTTLFGQVATLNGAILNQGGGPTAAQTAALQSLSNQISTVEANMAQYCAPSAPTPAVTADAFFKQVAGYAAIGAAVLFFLGTGIAATVLVANVYPYLRRLLARSRANPNEFPSSPADTVVGDNFSSATFGQIIAQAQGIAQTAANPALAQDVSSALNAQLSNDPIIANSQAQAEFFNTLGNAAVDEELADTYFGIASLYTEAAADGAATLDDALAEIALLA